MTLPPTWCSRPRSLRSSCGVWLEMLADLGAQVTLIEPPGGNSIRHQAPFIDDQPSPERSYQHLYFNVNKRSVLLDWRTEAGLDRLRALATSSDILIETHQPGEFPVAEVRAANPHLIVVSASPYGQQGPKSGWRATDLTATAAGGLLQISGERDDPPVHGSAYPGHTMTGLTVASSAMTALHGRDRTPGQPGAHIDISMQEATSFQVVQTSNPCVWRWRGEAPYRPALSQAIRCADDRWMGCNISPNKLPAFIAMLDEAGVEHDLDPDNWQVVRRAGRAAWQHLENPLQDLAKELAAVLASPDAARPLWARADSRYADAAIQRVRRRRPLPKLGPCSSTSRRRPSANRSAIHAVRSTPSSHPCLCVQRLGLGEHTNSTLPLPAGGDTEGRGGSAPFPDMPLAGIRVLDLTWVARGRSRRV